MSDYCERRDRPRVSSEGVWTRHDYPCGCVSRMRNAGTITHLQTEIGPGLNCGKPMRPVRFDYSDPIPDMHRLVEAAWVAAFLDRVWSLSDFFGSTSGTSEGPGYVYRYGDKWRRMAEWQRDRERRAWSAKATPGKRRHRR